MSKMAHPVRELGTGLRAAFADTRVRTLLMLTATLIGLASTAFHYAEGWRWLNSIYFSVVTIATVGFGDFAPKTDVGKIVTIVYVLCGLGLFVATATAIADAIILHTRQPARAPSADREHAAGDEPPEKP